MAEIRRSPVEGTVVFPIIYRVSYIPGGAGFQPSTVEILQMLRTRRLSNRWEYQRKSMMPSKEVLDLAMNHELYLLYPLQTLKTKIMQVKKKLDV